MALAHDPDCTAIYAANDQMAYGAMLGLQSAGKRVPEDVSIVGVDDSLVDMVPRLNLTTMKLRFDDIGASAPWAEPVACSAACAGRCSLE